VSNSEEVQRFLIANPHFAGTTRKLYEYTLRELDRFVNKPWRQVTVYDIDAFLQRKRAPGTQFSYLIRIKCFLRFIHEGNGDQLPERIKQYRIPRPRNLLSPQDLLTVDEMRRLLDACTTPRDKTIIALLYGTGARVREILRLKVRDIFPIDGVWRFIVHGKTGPFMGFIKPEVLPIVQNWLQHLNSPTPDSPLFSPRDNPQKSLSYHGFHYQLKQIARRAGITKRVFSHLFRHGRNTFLAQHVTDSIAKKIMGYAPNSTVFQRYVHLSDKQTTTAFCRSEGIAPPMPEEPQRLSPES
jgi:integrase